MSDTDLQLLARYVEAGAEDAFAELVRRHLNLVYSAALRQVRSPQLAEEVAQAVFVDLSRNARQLRPDTIVTAWLYAVTRRTAIDVVRRESRRQLREQIATEMNALNATDTSWTQLEPLLDDAMAALDETDRAAILLRYFENKSLREVGQALGTTDDTAQKRVSRAVERLREFFSKRNVTIGASGLVVVISANAAPAAPVGLAVTISSAAMLGGTAVQTSTLIAATTKTIAMTTLQKTIVGATLAAVVGTGLYQTHRASQLSEKAQSVLKQPDPLFEVVQRLQRERDAATNRLASLLAENEQSQSNQNAAELLKLRGEVTRLRSSQQPPTQSKTSALDPNDPSIQHFLAAKAQADQIARYLEQMPDKKIPELKLLTDVDWLSVSKDAKFDTDADIRKTLSTLRKFAKKQVPMGRALYGFTSEHNGQLPTDISQLKPYFKSALGDAPVDDTTVDAILGRYILLRAGNVGDLPQGAWIIAEKVPVDKDYDTRAKFGYGTSVTISTGIGETGDPDDKSY